MSPPPPPSPTAWITGIPRISWFTIWVEVPSTSSIIEIGEQMIEVLATAGDNHLGGDDFDQRLGYYYP